MRAHVDVQDRVMQVSQGCLCLHVLTMSGVVCQICAADPIGWAAEKSGRKHRGDKDREPKEAARSHEGREDPDVCIGRGERERKGWRHTSTPTTNDNQRRGATGRGRPDNSTGGCGRGEGGRDGVHPDF